MVNGMVHHAVPEQPPPNAQRVIWQFKTCMVIYNLDRSYCVKNRGFTVAKSDEKGGKEEAEDIVEEAFHRVVVGCCETIRDVIGMVNRMNIS